MEVAIMKNKQETPILGFNYENINLDLFNPDNIDQIDEYIDLNNRGKEYECEEDSKNITKKLNSKIFNDIFYQLINHNRICCTKSYVYLAGKIESNGWRNMLFDMRNEFFGYDYGSNKYKLMNTLYKYNNNIFITGPFFLSCDHSCYHGERDHGLGANEPNGCYGEDGYNEQDVVDICTEQIKHADIIFAYINDNSCYGTLFEIGLAKAMNKKIITLFDCEKRKRNMWFIAKNSDYSTSLEEQLN